MKQEKNKATGNRKSGDRFQNPYGGRKRNTQTHNSKKSYNRFRDKKKHEL